MVKRSKVPPAKNTSEHLSKHPKAPNPRILKSLNPQKTQNQNTQKKSNTPKTKTHKKKSNTPKTKTRKKKSNTPKTKTHKKHKKKVSKLEAFCVPQQTSWKIRCRPHPSCRDTCRCEGRVEA